MTAHIVEWILGHWSTLVEVGSVLLSISMAWWRFTKWVALNASAYMRLQEQVLALANSNIDMTRKMIEREMADRQHDKELARNEGATQVAINTCNQLIGQVKEVSAKIDAMWLTLQAIHPDRVPKRASDRPR